MSSWRMLRTVLLVREPGLSDANEYSVSTVLEVAPVGLLEGGILAIDGGGNSCSYEEIALGSGSGLFRSVGQDYWATLSVWTLCTPYLHVDPQPPII